MTKVLLSTVKGEDIVYVARVWKEFYAKRERVNRPLEFQINVLPNFCISLFSGSISHCLSNPLIATCLIPSKNLYSKLFSRLKMDCEKL